MESNPYVCKLLCCGFVVKKRQRTALPPGKQSAHGLLSGRQAMPRLGIPLYLLCLEYPRTNCTISDAGRALPMLRFSPLFFWFTVAMTKPALQRCT